VPAPAGEYARVVVEDQLSRDAVADGSTLQQRARLLS
jgi:hypothetical protein